MNEQTVSIRISKHLHDQLRAMSDQTGIPIKRLADRAIATQLAQQHKPAPSRAYDEEFYAGMELFGVFPKE